MKNATGILLLFLSSSIAFFNILLGHWQYVAFVPFFVAACVVKGRKGKIIETVGLIAVGVYILLVQAEYSGMVILFAATVWFYTYVHHDWRAKAYIIILSASISMASYFFFSFGSNVRWLHAIIDSAFFAVGSFALLFTLDNLSKNIRREYEKTIIGKVFGLIEGLNGTLHEAIDTLKDIKEGADHGRPK